jgi:hypothetical protein
VASEAAIKDATGGFAGDGQCAVCHAGCDDPHPGGRQASCVHCHGGDPTKADAAEAHPAPKYPKAWKDSANPERLYTLTLAESERGSSS